MTTRAKKFMDSVWKCRDNGADTEEKLVASILTLVIKNIKSFNAQNGKIVLDKEDILKLIEELSQ